MSLQSPVPPRTPRRPEATIRAATLDDADALARICNP